MVFSTTTFLFLFLPVFLGVYYALPFLFRRPGGAGRAAAARSAWLLAASWFFYGWWRFDFLGLLIAATVWTWLLGRRIGRLTADGRTGVRPARLALAAGVGLNLAVLAWFKYFNFGVDSLNAFLGLFGGAVAPAWRVILPAGVSFYVFQAISYLVDVYRGDASASVDAGAPGGAAGFAHFATFIALFPQLIAGPILRYKDVAGQLLRRDHSFGMFSEGAVRFMAGFCKKVLVADAVAPLADAAFGLARPGFADAWIGVLAYTVQIYFDFSGYSDMAIGLGRMIGFRFMENFDRPYLSRSITEFWRRWHISLSSWLRDYLYIPLGGNRRGTRRTYLNLLVVMLFGGLWHGASWTFVLWGLWHGLLLAIGRLAAGVRFRRAAPAAGPWAGLRSGAAVACTLLLVMVGWVLFRAPSVPRAAVMYAGMAGLHGFGVSDAFAWQISGTGLAALAIALVLTFAPARVPGGRPGRRPGLPALRAPAASGPAVVPLFLLGVAKLAADSFSPFLYFRF